MITRRIGKSSNRWRWSAAMSVIAILATEPAIAQDTFQAPVATPVPPTPDAATDEQDRSEVEPQQPGSAGDIVVTARKRDERLRDVPVAITAITGLQLQEKNIVQVIDLAATTPNFQFSYGAAAPFIFIRGFGSGANAAFEQSVGKFVNNISFGRDQDGRIPIFDVERLEVLKGPQVVAFGNSATVGALNVTTRKPGRSLAADGSAAYEFNDEEIQLQGGVTVPLTDWASLRVAGLYQDLGRGRVYNPVLDRREFTTRNWAIRPTLRLTPAPGLRITLLAEYDKLRDFGNGVQAIGQPLRPGALLYPEVGDKDVRLNNFESGLVSSRDLGAMNAQLYSGDVELDLLGGALTSTTAYRDTKSVSQFGTLGPNLSQPYWQSINAKYEQFSQELRFSGRYDALSVNGGGYYQRDTLNLNLIQYFQLGGYGLTGAAATPFGRLAAYEQKTRNLSAFLDLSYQITDALSLTAGVRYTDIGKRAGQTLIGIPIIPGIGLNTSRNQLLAARSPAIEALLPPVTGSTPHIFPFGTLSLKENHWQPQLIAQYKITATDNVYLKYVKGDKVGGFDYLYAGTNPSAARFQPEAAESFELGFKGLTLDGKLDYSIAAFRTTFTDLQQSVFSNLVFVVSNVGKARAQGIEADLQLALTDQLKVGVGGSYLDAKFVEFPGAACGTPQNLVTPRGCTLDLSNTPTQYSSKYSGTLTVDYEQPIASGRYLLGAGASVVARSKYNAGAYNDPRMVQNGFALIDAHIDLRPDQGWWSLSVFGRNLTNQQVLDYATLAPAQSTATFGTYARGRQIGLRMSANFR